MVSPPCCHCCPTVLPLTPLLFPRHADEVAIERRDYEGMLRSAQAQARGNRGPVSAGADAA